MAAKKNVEAEEAAAVEETKETVTTVEEAKKDPWQETEKVNLIYDDDHKRSQFVCVNGKWMTIPRGKDMDVPAPVAEVLKHAAEQQMAAIKMQDSLSSSFDESKI